MEYKSWERDSVYPSFEDPFFAEHLARYHFISSLVREKTVLDVGSGKGYGSFLLSKYAKRVIGLDLNDHSIDFSTKTYKNDNLQFVKQDLIQIPLTSKFDVIVCFEVIEHIPPQESHAFLLQLKKLLNPHGILILSTPNHEVVLRSGMPVPDFHINNYRPGDLKKFLSQHFSKVTMYGQIAKGSLPRTLLYFMDQLNLRHYFIKSLKPADNSTDPTEAELYNKKPWTDLNDIKSAQNFIFSKYLWRQAGMTLAICQD